jgi:hypothetical protein
MYLLHKHFAHALYLCHELNFKYYLDESESSEGNGNQQVLGRTNRICSFDTTRDRIENDASINCHGNAFTELLPSNDSGIHRQTYRHTRPTIILLLCVFIAEGTCLPSRCLATGGIHFTEPLPSNKRRNTHIGTQTDGRDL